MHWTNNLLMYMVSYVLILIASPITSFYTRYNWYIYLNVIKQSVTFIKHTKQEKIIDNINLEISHGGCTK